MPRHGSGTYTLPQSPFSPNTVISSTAVNSDLSDIATALTGSISADGQTPITGALKFASGNAGAPGVAFNSDTTSGMYLSSVGTLGLAAGGTSIGTSTSSTTAWALNTTIAGTLGVTGAVTLSSTLGVTGAATLSSTLGVTGAATLSSTLGVTGAVTVTSATATLA